MKCKLAALMIALSATVSYAGTSYVGRGGQTVTIDGKTSLRDLVDKTNCYWVLAYDLGASLDHFPTVLRSIDAVHWMLAFELQSEAKTVKVCETRAPLVPIPTKDQDGLTIETIQNATQVAIRLNDEIYLDMDQFEKLSQIDRAYLLVHELMHSFMPIQTPLRDKKLRSFIAALRQNEIAPLTSDGLALQISQDGIDFPQRTLPTEQKDRYAGIFSGQYSGMALDTQVFALKSAITEDAANALCFSTTIDPSWQQGGPVPDPVCAARMPAFRRVQLETAFFSAQYTHFLSAIAHKETEDAVQLISSGYSPNVQLGWGVGNYRLWYVESSDSAALVSDGIDFCKTTRGCGVLASFNVSGVELTAGAYRVENTAELAIERDELPVVAEMIRLGLRADTQIGEIDEPYSAAKPAQLRPVFAAKFAQDLGHEDIVSLLTSQSSK